jgi:hypothetical protein
MSDLKILFIFVVLFLGPALSPAADFHVDPVNGSDGGDGSAAQPWKSLQRLFDEAMIESREWNALPYKSGSYLVPKNPGAPIKAGDTIILHSGSYGVLNIRSYYNAAPIALVAEQGHTPLFRNIAVRSSRNWSLAGLTVNASAFQADGFSTLISLESHNWTGPIDTITITGCNLYSIGDSSAWSKTDWNSKAKNGISVSGKNMKIAYNILRNVNFGISVGAGHSMVEHNIIENFAGDGLRGLGDYTTFQYNTVKNSYDVNDNHDDGFQSWSVGSDGKVGTGVVRGIVLRGNTIINYEDPNQPFRGTLQGIGCFDGMFADWVVERNTVRVDHWHGISLYGAINTVIKDNVVTDPNGDANVGPPWIMLRAHKNNTPSRDCLVTCNVSPKLIVSDEPTITNLYNTLSETGGPRHSKCPALSNIVPVILPVLLDAHID